MAITPEAIQEHLPYYLTQEAKDGILQELKKFPNGFQYCLLGMHQYREDMLQGDGWTHLHLRDFGTGQKLHVSGVVLSNTCDVAPENKRDLPVNILFAPLIPMSALMARLASTGASEERISAKMDAIRKQHVTNLFYVPAGNGVEAEHVVLLDDVHAMPVDAFTADRGVKIFTLSQAGFYLFIIKLSMHFCRFHEDLIRA